MTDLSAAIAALRAERDANASVGHEPISWFLVDAALAALDAAQRPTREKVKDTLTDYLDHYPHPEFLDAVMAHLAPQAPPAAVAVPEVLVRAYFHRFSEVEDDYTIYHTLDGVCEQCIPVLIVRDAAIAAMGEP